METQELKRIASIVALDEITAFDKEKLCTRLRTLLSQMAELKVEIDELKDALIHQLEEDGEELYIGHGIKAMQYCRSGQIVWKDIPEVQALDTQYIEKFRKDDSFIWKVVAV